MTQAKFIPLALAGAILFASYAKAQKPINNSVATSHGGAKHAAINTADEALAELKNGNQRFMEGKLHNTNYKEDIEQTKSDQHPHSLILSCLDSRIPPEIIFDQGIGNIFVARVAGNIEDPNILGSMEFATKVKGTKLIVVMGHNKCGAVKGAIDNAELGNLTQLVDQIKPAITGDKSNMDKMLNETAEKNVQLTISDILKQSPVIAEQVKQGTVKIVGAFYDLTSGKVNFMN
ncbi:MAG: carbonic anhydrase family protein [Bacteroidetes bacterium]|nr:carbonic anhydrase family protein [Bacteroidota bacterium]